jgi:4-amino-4-deoxy-L-arabinose transferase-like glycosyltransferase
VDKLKQSPLFLYGVVLFSSLGLTPLWLDEIQQFANSRHTTIPELMRWVQLNAGASPLPYLAQHVFTGWFGYSTWAARFPAALCSVLSGAVFAIISLRFLKGGSWIALVLFLVLPVQFRYGIEARVYSQGLLFSLVTFWLYLRLQERYSTGLLVLYGLVISVGLYSQPLTIFPVLTQMFQARRAVIASACAAIVSYLPWYFAQHRAQVQYALIAPPTPFFSLQQLDPRSLLHDLTGGGYVCGAVLIVLGVWAIVRAPQPRLLLSTLAISFAGPIVMDAIFNYFFAERQLLYSMPALVLLAAQGTERLRVESRNILAWALITAFLVSAGVKDFRQATTPRDDLAATADALVTHLRPGACVLAVPREQFAFYLFFRTELEGRLCPDDPRGQEILSVSSVYTTPAQRRTFFDAIAPRFESQETVKVGQSELTIYRRRRS